MTTSTRQITTMKYGLRIENPGMLIYPITLLANSSLAKSITYRAYTRGIPALPRPARALAARLQTAAIADHHLLAIVQPGKDLGVAARLQSQPALCDLRADYLGFTTNTVV